MKTIKSLIIAIVLCIQSNKVFFQEVLAAEQKDSKYQEAVTIESVTTLDTTGKSSSGSSGFRASMVKHIAFIKDEYGNFREGLKAEYSPDGKLIVYHKKGSDGYRDVYVMHADGSNEICLTCNKKELPNKHKGVPYWHPSGKYIIFQVEKKRHVLPRSKILTDPAIGLHNDIWLMTSDGKRFWQLTNLRTKKRLFFDRTVASAILLPHFSHDGKKLSWVERIGKGGKYKWGIWTLKVADFVIDENNLPSTIYLANNILYNQNFLSNIKSYQFGVQGCYHESNDFSSDDKKLIFCGNLESNQTEAGLDIYEMNLDTPDQAPNRLTKTLNDFDESGHYSPDGEKIVWLSTVGYPAKDSFDWASWAKTDYWIMDSDGNNKEQLTYFNKPGTADFDLVGGKRVIHSFISWRHDGKALVGTFIVENADKSFSERMVTIDLK